MGLTNFVVKKYNDEEGVIIKGNGFDGLGFKDEREVVEKFVEFLNKLIDFKHTIEIIKDIDCPNCPLEENNTCKNPWDCVPQLKTHFLKEFDEN